METGEISRKLKRGRHTTRHSQVIPVGENIFLMDTPGFSSLYLMDMERAEVLRGPQGTLFGQNSESGVVNLVRRVPDNTKRAHIFTEGGTYNTYRLGASASAPILEDKVFFSGSFLRHQSDGYVENLYKDSTRAARNDGSAYGMAGLEHGLHLCISLGQADQQRALAVGRQSVALIGRGVFALIEQGMRRHMGAQSLHHLGLAPSTLGLLGRVMRGVGSCAGGGDEIGKSAGGRHACKCRGCARALV